VAVPTAAVFNVNPSATAPVFTMESVFFLNAETFTGGSFGATYASAT
jgi:hypothetical protein